MTIRLGDAFDFSDIVGEKGRAWICFAASEFNPRIIRLAPLSFEKQPAQRLSVRTQGGETAWLTEGCEVSLHEQDLGPERFVELYDVIPMEIASKEDGSAQLPMGDDYHEWLIAARRIEAHFHVSMNSSSMPSI